MRRGTKTWVGRVGAAALVTFALGYVPYHVYARSGLARTLQLRRDLGTLRARNADIRAGNERLVREADALRSDPDAIERVARAELGWVRPGEVIVDLSRPDVEPASATAVTVARPAARLATRTATRTATKATPTSRPLAKTTASSSLPSASMVGRLR